ncbi:MAG: GNAT family N-acetyltransferase [Treponema sp.]|nr:GNAT family N-acetyltransferase [Treponema sp.]
MIFDLTDSLAAAILYAMENQEERSVLDAEHALLVPAGSVAVDGEKVYSLPQWTSADGFKMLEDFVFSLGESAAKAELKAVLISGRGVFRNFKNVLKSFPEVERRWHVFKDMQLRSRLMEWYNALRESWGLEALAQDFDEYDDLTEQDFTFSTYDAARDADGVAYAAHAVAEELSKTYAGELGRAAADLFLACCSRVLPEQKSGLVCRSFTDDFAGCLLFAPCPSPAKETVVLTDFFVVQNYRGLGIARELMMHCLSQLKERGIHWFIIANTTIPQTLDSLIARMGFERKGTVLAADVTKF